MTILFTVGILAFVTILGILVVELRYREKLESMRDANPLGLVISQIILIILLLNSIWLSLVDTLDMVGDVSHIFFIMLSTAVAIQIGLGMFERKKTPSDPIEREVWWINGFLMGSKNPIETFESHIGRTLASKQLSNEQKREILQKISIRDDAVGDKVRELLQTLRSGDNQ